MMASIPRPAPLYRQASEWILQRLQAHEWQEGEALPNEFLLAAQYQVSQGTMRKALDLLVEEGILLRRQGAGTFVAVCQDFIATAQANQVGEVATSERIAFELVSITRMHATAQIAEELNLRRHTPLWQLTRLLRVRASLFAIDQAFLPKSLFPMLEAKRLRQWKANLKQMCLIQFGMHVAERNVRYRAVLPNQEIYQLLQLTQDIPLLERVSVIHNKQNHPVIWGITTFKTDEFSFCPVLSHIL